MPRPRSFFALHRLVKRLITCLILAAILQYVVAAAFGLLSSYSGDTGRWDLQIREPGYVATLTMTRHHSFGREVLAASFSLISSGRFPANATPPDWSQGRWQQFEPVHAVVENRPIFSSPIEQHAPPAWSRFATICTDPEFDYYPTGGWGNCLEVACGWPFCAASYFGCGPAGLGNYVVREGVMISNAASTSDKTPRAVPLRIHWAGTILNTLIYAPAAFVLLSGASWFHRHLRRRAGRCVNCNYDLRATTTGTCPECGAAITPRATSSAHSDATRH